MSREGHWTAGAPSWRLPWWIAPLLLIAALPGLLEIFAALVVVFGGDVPFGPGFGGSSDTRFVDVATLWARSGPGSTSSWSSVAALAAFAVVMAVHPRQQRPFPSRLCLAAFWLTTMFSLLELSATLTVVAGYLQMSADPTAVRGFWTESVNGLSAVASCVVLSVLAAVVAWALWTERRLATAAPDSRSEVGQAPAPSTSSHQGTTAPPLDQDAVFRRPT
ncbi:MAG: hypothetical protein M3Z83_04915 [Actinomycetota bacterium]|nr:hypothetical protein [Actinomycetota bacterium]